MNIERKNIDEVNLTLTMQVEKADYMEALFETRDMHRATNAAFGGKDRLQLFVSEWLRFWKER